MFRRNDGIPITGKEFNEKLRLLLGPHIDYHKGKITAQKLGQLYIL